MDRVAHENRFLELLFKACSKYEHVAQLKPDIMIVQECEQLPSDFFPEADYHWVGHDTRKKG